MILTFFTDNLYIPGDVVQASYYVLNGIS